MMCLFSTKKIVKCIQFKLNILRDLLENMGSLNFLTGCNLRLSLSKLPDCNGGECFLPHAECTFRILGGWQAVSLGGGVTVMEKQKFWQGG